MLDAVITAGGDPQKDADLLACAPGASVKAMITHDGKTFLEYIVSALLGSGRIEHVVVVGLPSEYQLDLGAAVVYVPDKGGLVENAWAGVTHLASSANPPERIVLASSDVPLITPTIVNDLIDQCWLYDVDFCYTVVRQEVMERAFPESGRTFISLADGKFAGGDLALLKPSVLQVKKDRLYELIGQRKTFWKQVRAVGLDTLFLLLIRRLTIARIEQRCERVLGISGKAVICPHAEIAMDVDKPHHLELVRAALSQRENPG